MKTVVDFALFFAAVFLGILWFSVIALPVLYGLPRATWWALRGRIPWRAVARFLAAPIIWSFLFLGASLLLRYFAPSIAQHLQSSSAFAWGQWVGVIVMTVRVLGAPSTRQDLNHDFLGVLKPYLTPSQMIASAVPEPRAARSLAEIIEHHGALLALREALQIRDEGDLSPEAAIALVEYANSAEGRALAEGLLDSPADRDLVGRAKAGITAIMSGA